MKFLSLILSLLLTFQVFAECDFSTIKQIDANTWAYQKDCHLLVGQLVRDESARKQQVELLNQSISLKDLAISKADERTELWRNTSYKLEDRLITQDKYQSYTRWGYFALGAAAVVLGGWAAGQASK
jgi:hypothetical protein